jgi:malonyl CoA-acyl carrier protein transacylase
MSEASRRGELDGAMAYVIGLARPAVEDALAALTPDRARLAIATENAAAQFILTGERALVAAAVEALRPKALKTDLLSIKIPMHSGKLSSLCDRLQGFLERGIRISQPRAALFAPMLGRRVANAEEAALVLSKQICRPSHWATTLRSMSEVGLVRFAEVGPGDTLTKMTRWTLRDATVAKPALEDPESIEAFAKSLAPPPLFPFKEKSTATLASARQERLGSEAK